MKQNQTNKQAVLINTLINYLLLNYTWKNRYWFTKTEQKVVQERNISLPWNNSKATQCHPLFWVLASKSPSNSKRRRFRSPPSSTPSRPKMAPRSTSSASSRRYDGVSAPAPSPLLTAGGWSSGYRRRPTIAPPQILPGSASFWMIYDCCCQIWMIYM